MLDLGKFGSNQNNNAGPNLGQAVLFLSGIVFVSMMFALVAAIIASGVFKVPFYEVVNTQLSVQIGFFFIGVIVALAMQYKLYVFIWDVLFGGVSNIFEKFIAIAWGILPVIGAVAGILPVYGAAFTYYIYARIFGLELEGASYIYDGFAAFHEKAAFTLMHLVNWAITIFGGQAPLEDNASAWKMFSFYIVGGVAAIQFLIFAFKALNTLLVSLGISSRGRPVPPPPTPPQYPSILA